MSTDEAAPKRGRVDKRGSIPRQIARIRKALAKDLEQPLSAADDAMLRAAALAIYRVNELEAATMRGEAIDDDAAVRLLNSAHRMLASVCKRGRKSSAPDVREYLERRKQI